MIILSYQLTWTNALAIHALIMQPALMAWMDFSVTVGKEHMGISANVRIKWLNQNLLTCSHL